MPGLEWVFRLKDQMSGPAVSMETQLRRVTGALKMLDLQSKQARLEKLTEPLKRSRLELQIQRDKLLMSTRALKDHERSTSSASRSWTESLVRFAGSLYILDTIAKGFRAVGHAAIEMGGQIKDAVEVRQRGLFGFRATLGDQAGGSFFTQLQRQAQVYGRPTEELVGMGQSFLRTGAPPDQVGQWIAATQDVRARSGDAAAGQFQGAVQEMLSSPVFGMGNLHAFGGVFGMKKMFESFSKQMGVRVGDVEGNLNLNQVRSDVAGRFPAAQDMLLKFLAGQPGQDGTIGGLAAKFGGSTLEGAIGRVQTAWQSLLGSMEKSKGVKTLQTVLQNLAATLGGKDLRTSLTSLVDTLGKIIEPLTGPDGKKRMEQFFDAMAAGAKKSIGEMGEVIDKLKWFYEHFGRSETIENLSDTLAERVAVGKVEGEIADRRAAHVAEIMALPGSRPMDRFNRGLVGAETQVMRTRPVTVNVGGISMKFDGVTKDDAHALTKSFTDQLGTALSDALEQVGIEQGSQPGPSGGTP